MERLCFVWGVDWGPRLCKPAYCQRSCYLLDSSKNLCNFEGVTYSWSGSPDLGMGGRRLCDRTSLSIQSEASLGSQSHSARTLWTLRTVHRIQVAWSGVDMYTLWMPVILSEGNPMSATLTYKKILQLNESTRSWYHCYMGIICCPI